MRPTGLTPKANAFPGQSGQDFSSPLLLETHGMMHASAHGHARDHGRDHGRDRERACAQATGQALGLVSFRAENKSKLSVRNTDW